MHPPDRNERIAWPPSPRPGYHWKRLASGAYVEVLAASRSGVESDDKEGR